MFGKVVTGVRHPSRIPSYLRRRYRDAKINYLSWQNGSNLYPIELDNYSLYIDLNDDGIGRDLALEGVREPISSSAYRNELLNLRNEIDGTIQVVEIGANIGYYALIPPVIIDDIKVFAAEVSPENTDLLCYNIEANEVEDSFEIDCLAIGDEDSKMELQLSTHSNRHSLNKAVDTQKKRAGSETVTIKRGETWLTEKGTSGSEIDVLRMDTEGYESKILRGIPDLNPDLAHIEAHPVLMDDEEIDYMIEWVNDIGLNIVAAAQNKERVSISEIEEIQNYNWIELVLS